jgi:hypothetical protein
MELKGDILINAKREKVWLGLNDTELLMRCIPGCESMQELSPNERQATVKIKIGPVRARFTGKVKMIDIHPEQGYTLQFEGSGGAAGMAKGQSVVTLVDDNDSTRLNYTVQASIGGKLGQVGGRMIDAAAKQIADQFFAVFQTELSGAPTGSLGVVQSIDASKSTPETQEINTSTQSPVSSSHHQPTLFVNAPAHVSPATPSESVRITWFILGVLSTGFGVWLGHLIS